jgi:hypothetical protein
MTQRGNDGKLRLLSQEKTAPETSFQVQLTSIRVLKKSTIPAGGKLPMKRRKGTTICLAGLARRFALAADAGQVRDSGAIAVLKRAIDFLVALPHAVPIEHRDSPITASIRSFINGQGITS